MDEEDLDKVEEDLLAEIDEVMDLARPFLSELEDYQPAVQMAAMAVVVQTWCKNNSKPNRTLIQMINIISNDFYPEERNE